MKRITSRMPLSPVRGGRELGVTLIEMLIVLLIISILASIAYPSYIDSTTRTKRRAAAVCLSSFATHMERFYTSNLRYEQDSGGTAMNTTRLLALGLDCATAQNTGANYTYSFDAIARSTYTLQAVPRTTQSARDPGCGTLKLDQAGTRTITGTSTVSKCW